MQVRFLFVDRPKINTLTKSKKTDIFLVESQRNFILQENIIQIIKDMSIVEKYLNFVFENINAKSMKNLLPYSRNIKDKLKSG